jgi:hypothetical protein
MRRLKQLGYTVQFVDLPPDYPWGLFPAEKVVLMQCGLPPSRYRKMIREVLTAMPAPSAGQPSGR